MLEIEIDGKTVSVEPGSTVMDAANQLGVYVPHFCYHKKLSIAANCRMCLVEVEKAPKPLPACATPVNNGMKVKTRSELAVKAQKGVMEFLLINHPLDCPICDQGGECLLQDLSVGYGGVDSRYGEEKRVVPNKNLGPLIATDMTRCINCTRCVRFGQEVAGIMELGQANRGEHAEIMTFVSKTVDSTLSGNMIDLCPVGALTSKPFRYSARSWELYRRKSVSPHCGLGSNLIVQVKNNKVMRVLPDGNESVNECWISDKDRFSYEALNSPDRLEKPMIKQGGQWREVSWQNALEYVATGLQDIAKKHGAGAIGALATAHSTAEELYLLQKMMRGIGSENIDFRLRKSDFSLDGKMNGAPWLGMRISEINLLDRVLVVGSLLDQDHPLIAHRLREAAKAGCEINLVNPTADEFALKAANKAVVSPARIVSFLEEVLQALSKKTKNAEANAVAKSLSSGKNAAVFMGNIAEHHPDSSLIHNLCLKLAQAAGARFGILGEAANSVGGYLAKAIPGASGMNAKQMLESPRKAYVLLHAEIELDAHDPAAALSAMDKAEMVVAMSAFRHRAFEYADVMLPIGPFTETSGTFVNTEGRMQSFSGAVKPAGEARPAWKVLRVLGNLLNLDGFGHDTSEEVRDEFLAGDGFVLNLDNGISDFSPSESKKNATLQRIGTVPIYFADALCRRAPSLQNAASSVAPKAFMSGRTLENLGLKEGDPVLCRQGEASATLNAACDRNLADDCVRAASGHPLTSGLGAMYGEISVERL